MAPIKDTSSRITASEISKAIQTGSMSLEAAIDMIEKALAAKKINSKQALQLLAIALKLLKKDGKARYPKLSTLLVALSKRSTSPSSPSQTVPVT
ncbi:MAG: hypothetical protein IIU23_05400, partial [Bacteroidales bacterium]|nr:hypothetical protein [Bacteroidales bacterium]